MAIYLLSELLLTVFQTVWLKPQLSFYDWINQVFYQKIFPGAFGTLVFALCYMMLCWLVGLWMDKRKIYIRV